MPLLSELKRRNVIRMATVRHVHFFAPNFHQADLSDGG